jgi:molecular chaperone GrpE (heat shock protein)
VDGLDHTLTWLEARILALASDLRNPRKRTEKRAEELLNMVTATLIARVVKKLSALGIDPKAGY